MPDWSWLFGALALAVATPGLLTSLHLAVMTAAAVCYRAPRLGLAPPVRFLVVVPAHNEELVLAATLDAINADMRQRDLLLVVDDRSTDRTAAIAGNAGAVVLRRAPGSTPGRAAARQAAIQVSSSMEWDAMVMIDADSIVAPGFFDACERMLGSGATALQARSEAAAGSRFVDQAALASFAVQGVLLPRGRDRLRMLVRLRGTGMVLRRDVVERLRFTATASEDLVATLELCLRGERIRHVDDARLRSANAGSWRTASTQKARYEAGRMAAARAYVGPLLRTRTIAGLEAAWFLVSAPFATAAACLLAGLALAMLGGASVVSWILVAALGALASALLVAMWQARVPARSLLALVAAPAYLVWKVGVQVRAAVAVQRGVPEFGPTPRDG